MLMPKRVKRRKVQKGRNRGFAWRGSLLSRNYDHLKAKSLLALAREDGLISTRTGLVTPAVLESLHHFQDHPQLMDDIVDWPPGAPADGESAGTYRSSTP